MSEKLPYEWDNKQLEKRYVEELMKLRQEIAEKDKTIAEQSNKIEKAEKEIKKLKEGIGRMMLSKMNEMEENRNEADAVLGKLFQSQTNDQQLHAALKEIEDLKKINSDQKEVIDIHLKLIDKYEKDIESMKEQIGKMLIERYDENMKEFESNAMSGKPFYESRSKSSLKGEIERLKDQLKSLKEGHESLVNQM